jgi:uncharacterized membrane protein
MGTYKLRLSSIILAGIGLIDALYLTGVKLSNTYTLCGPIGNCETVNTSQYSQVFGIPIALIGAAAYFLILILLLIENRNDYWVDYSPMLVFGISLAGVLYSAYLTFLEIAVIKAICPYCILSFIIIISIFILTLVRLIQGQSEMNTILQK